MKELDHDHNNVLRSFSGSMVNTVLGVDPGVRGGVAVLNGDGQPIFVKGFCPSMTEKEVEEQLIAALGFTLPDERKTRCFFEKVGYMPHDGGKGSFTFGKAVGFMRGVLTVMGCEMRDVYPMIWQSRLGCLSRGNKNVTKRKAQQLFPTMKITHAIADALLIAEYGRRALLET